MSKKTKISVIVLTSYIIITTIACTIFGISTTEASSLMTEDLHGIGYFKAFTSDSNILCGISSIFLLIYTIIDLIKNKKAPKWVHELFYIATSAVGVTFAVVLLALMPVVAIRNPANAYHFYWKDSLFFHLLNPLAAIATFFLIRKDHTYTMKDNILAMICTFIYSIVYFLQVVIFKNWTDFYEFTLGGRMWYVPLCMIEIYTTNFLISFALRKICLKNKAK